MEILAPAGNREALERAQAAGADAVYLGYAAFSARAGAGNFDEEQLREALRFAHLHRMRVYVTVNTLVKDRELPEVYQLLRLLNHLRADGILVQDPGVLRLARRCFPGLRVHASTQMAIHNETGVRWCAAMGMKRVVLARECSLEEIRRCVKTGMEIEVFGHGAQCVSVSGECLFSSMVGERSGNRGRCAQPCRKKYYFDGREGAWLSPRDLCLRDRIPELTEAGISSLKIEGRLKRPEYVYTVAKSYRDALDCAENGDFRKAGEAETDGLKQMFHRGGFMEGYAFGAEDAGVIQPEWVNHQGLRIGRITECRGNLAKAELERNLGDGDGLRIRHGGIASEMTYAGRDARAGETVTLRLRDGMRAERGDELFRLTDSLQLRKAMEAPLRRIPADMTLKAFPGKPMSLRVSDGETEITVTGEEVSPARTREVLAEELEKQLRKTGGTDFEAGRVLAETKGAFVPVSAVNALRREALSRLAEARADAFAYPEGPENPLEETGGESLRKDAKPEADDSEELWVIARNPDQAGACRDGMTRLIWYPEDFRKEALNRLLEEMKPGDWLKLPEVCGEETLQELHRAVCRFADRLGGVMLGSVGQLGLSWPVPVAAGSGIPVMNLETVRLLGEQGCRFVTASPELSGEELSEMRRALAEKEQDGRMPRILLPAYGRTQLMLLHHCPARTALGMRTGHENCRFCDLKDPRALAGKELTDERGYRFPLQRIRLQEGCLIRLLNALPLDLGEKRTGFSRLAEMTTESPEEASEALSALRRHQKTPGESTRGHWNRPVL